MFGTKLTRVTRLLRDRDRDRALARVADAVNDWAGGTRIGESFREFNLRWARRTLRTSGIVIVVSDGWDRGDPALVATETARLRRNCHRLVWLNPLAGTPGYEPLAGGMRAAYPYIDDFLPAGTVASLERLGEILAGVRSSDVRRGGEAAASADAGARAGVTIRDARAADGRSSRAHVAADGSAAAPMKELLADARSLAPRRRRDRPGGRRPDVRVGAAPGGRRPAPRRRRADRRLGQRRLRRGRGGGGDRAGAARRQLARHPLRDQRRGGVGRRAGVRRHDRRPDRAGRAGGGRGRSARDAAASPSRRRFRRMRRRPSSGRRRPATAPRRAPTVVVAADGIVEGSLGSPAADAALVGPPREALLRGTSRTVEIEGRSVFVEAFPARPRLVVVGAVEVARSLVRFARELGYETIVVDGRASFATPERFPPDQVDRLIVGWPDEVADEIGLGPDDAVAVLTHDVKFDEPAIIEALRRSCRYVGAVGSRKTQGDRRERLRAAGVGEDELARLRGPSASTSAAGPRPRPPSRSWPRSSPAGTAGSGAPDARGGASGPAQ